MNKSNTAKWTFKVALLQKAPVSAEEKKHVSIIQQFLSSEQGAEKWNGEIATLSKGRISKAEAATINLIRELLHDAAVVTEPFDTTKVDGPVVVVPGEAKAVHITCPLNHWGVMWPRIVTLVGGAVVGDLLDDQDGNGLCKAEEKAFAWPAGNYGTVRHPVLGRSISVPWFYWLDYQNPGDTGYEYLIEGGDGVTWEVLPFSALQRTDGLTWFEIKDEAEFEASKLGKGPNQQPGTIATPIQFLSKKPNQLLRLRLVIPQK